MIRLMPQDPTVVGRPPSRTCEDCGKPTRERKPFCSDHIVNHGYPKHLDDVLKGVSDELKAVAKHGHRAVQLDGLVVEEILAGIASSGQLSWRRLLKDHVAFLVNEPSHVTGAYLQKLRNADLINVRPSGRKMDVVSLTEAGAALVRGKHV
jgi:hypothetical protein